MSTRGHIVISCSHQFSLFSLSPDNGITQPDNQTQMCDELGEDEDSASSASTRRGHPKGRGVPLWGWCSVIREGDGWI